MNTTTLAIVQPQYEKYCTWLDRQPLSDHSRRNYRSRVNLFLGFVAADLDEASAKNVISDAQGRDFVVRQYKSHLKLKLKMKPTSVNSNLAALDNFYDFLGLGRAKVTREDLPHLAPRALSKPEQNRLLLAIARSQRAMDRAIAILLLNTGLRIGECAALNLDDVPITQRKGTVIVRSGKGDRYREVPLNAEARTAVKTWLEARAQKFCQKFAGRDEQALFVNPQGRRLSTSSIDLIVRKIGKDAGIDLSAHTLRHSCLTNLVRQGNDLVMVAEIGGHSRLETTRRYTLPSAGDKEQAMEGLAE